MLTDYWFYYAQPVPVRSSIYSKPTGIPAGSRWPCDFASASCAVRELPARSASTCAARRDARMRSGGMR